MEVKRIKLPPEFEKRMSELLGKEYYEFLKAYEVCDTYKGIRINPLKKESKDKIFELCGELPQISWADNGYYIEKDKINGKHPYHISGLVYFQEPSAMSTVSALGIRKGDYVLDLCAAPGGKATQVCEALFGEGLLVANEIVQKRAKILAENLQRMGIRNAVVTNESPDRLAEKYKGCFDKIIVDAPCSGEGMFKKEPQAVSEWSVEHTLSCAVRQKNILESAFSMLKPGGRLIYSTCTFSPDENELVALWVLENYPDVKLLPIELQGMSDGFAHFSDKFDLTLTKRIFPHKADGEGHFVALFEKSGGVEQLYEKHYTTPKEKLYRDFERENLNIALKGEIVAFGDNLYMLPCGFDIDKIKVVMAGLYLGTCKKDRFEPSHALCLSLKPCDFKRNLEIAEDDTAKYFRGETLMAKEKGWYSVSYNGINIGLGKASDGILKNHFPKYMRF